MTRVGRWALAVALVCAHPASFAVRSNPGVTDAEWKLLPRACMYVEGAPGKTQDPVTTRRLYASDPTWVHMHHYCWAIVQEIRMHRVATSKKIRGELADAAIQNLDYAIDRSKPGFELRPDMLYRKTKLLLKRGKIVFAADTAKRLISESPDRPEGYVALAEVQTRAGDAAAARETLRKGRAQVEDKARFDAMQSVVLR